MSLPERKTMRLKVYDYSRPGAYFITVCTGNRRCILSTIVGTGLPDGPLLKLSAYGKIAEEYIIQMSEYYSNISVDKYVIMPNHIHLLLNVFDRRQVGGPSGTPVPTVQNSTVSMFISTFKRFCNKKYGENIWQPRSYDHIVRDKEDYNAIVKYIYDNPMNWYYDELYSND